MACPPEGTLGSDKVSVANVGAKRV